VVCAKHQGVKRNRGCEVGGWHESGSPYCMTDIGAQEGCRGSDGLPSGLPIWASRVNPAGERAHAWYPWAYRRRTLIGLKGPLTTCKQLACHAPRMHNRKVSGGMRLGPTEDTVGIIGIPTRNSANSPAISSLLSVLTGFIELGSIGSHGLKVAYNL
jgi:hypothetical protein